MAKMHPFYKDEEINLKINGPGAIGERQLYRWLRDMPDTDDWDVLYDNRIHSGADDVQTDFLVFCPGMGIVNVDAKGRGYHYNDNEWFLGSNSDNIFYKADKAIHTLDHYIREHLTGRAWGAYGKLIVFTEAPPTSSGPIPGDYHYLTPNRDMVTTLRDSIKEELSYSHQAKDSWKYFPNHYKLILSHFCQKFELKPFCFDFQNNDRTLDSCLTLKQQEISAAIEDNTFVHVTGGAGTGKTLLAMSCAIRFAKKQKVLYVCFNKSLAEFLKNTYRQRNFTITHFDVIPQELLHMNFRYTMDNKNEIDWEQSREEICDILLNGVNDKYKFDRIFVDESQDMTPDMLEAMQFLLKPVETSKIAFFSDSAQRIFQNNWSFPYDRFDKEVEESKLRVNMRNSDNIHHRIIEYSEEHTIAGGWITGKKPEIFQESVVALIERLREEDGIQPYDIAVLAYNTDTLTKINNHVQKKIHFTDKLTEWDEEKILKTTVQSFKGLEANVIIIPDAPRLSDSEKIKHLCYVGESRAKYRLYVHSED